MRLIRVFEETLVWKVPILCGVSTIVLAGRNPFTGYAAFKRFDLKSAEIETLDCMVEDNDPSNWIIESPKGQFCRRETGRE